MNQCLSDEKTNPNTEIQFPPKHDQILMSFFCVFTVFGEYLWYLDPNIININKSVVRMRSLERGMVLYGLGLGKLWAGIYIRTKNTNWTCLEKKMNFSWVQIDEHHLPNNCTFLKINLAYNTCSVTPLSCNILKRMSSIWGSDHYWIGLLDLTLLDLVRSIWLWICRADTVGFWFLFFLIKLYWTDLEF